MLITSYKYCYAAKSLQSIQLTATPTAWIGNYGCKTYPCIGDGHNFLSSNWDCDKILSNSTSMNISDCDMVLFIQAQPFVPVDKVLKICCGTKPQNITTTTPSDYRYCNINTNSYISATKLKNTPTALLTKNYGCETYPCIGDNSNTSASNWNCNKIFSAVADISSSCDKILFIQAQQFIPATKVIEICKNNNKSSEYSNNNRRCIKTSIPTTLKTSTSMINITTMVSLTMSSPIMSSQTMLFRTILPTTITSMPSQTINITMPSQTINTTTTTVTKSSNITSPTATKSSNTVIVTAMPTSNTYTYSKIHNYIPYTNRTKLINITKTYISINTATPYIHLPNIEETKITMPKITNTIIVITSLGIITSLLSLTMLIKILVQKQKQKKDSI